jgi:hypothetical protein
MDHVVYCDAQSNELALLLSGTKTMLIRSATGRKLPYGRVQNSDTLYFINNNAEGAVRASGTVRSVFFSEPLTSEASEKLVQSHQDRLQLSNRQFKRWAGKRYITQVEVSDVKEIVPFSIDKSAYSNMDDWLPVGEIARVITH